MKIVHRLINAARELVFESPWGNSVHFQMGNPWSGHDGTKYWMNLSSSMELKFKAWFMSEGMNDTIHRQKKDIIEDRLEGLRDPNESHKLEGVMDILFDEGGRRFPWIPCREDEPLVCAYFVECFDKLPLYYDIRYFREHKDCDPDRCEPEDMVGPEHPLMQEVKQKIWNRKVATYDSREDYLYDFLSEVCLIPLGRDMLLRHGLLYSDRLPLASIKYILSKAM